jgi:tetratricopeptide (TPR) repeat protein
MRFSPVKPFSDTVRVFLNGKAVYARAVSFTTLHLFSDSLLFTGSLKADSGHLVVTIGELRYDSDPNAGVLARPVDAPADFNWNTAYGQYLKGVEAMDQKNYPEAETALQKALGLDSNFLPALTQYANLLYRNLYYDRALHYATRALSINTEDGPANFIYGLANEALGRLTDAKDGFDIAALDPAFRSAAYTRLAILAIREKDIVRARGYTGRALLANPINNEALHLQAVCNRPDNSALLDRLDSLDPLDHFVGCERYLVDPTPENKAHFLGLIRSELPEQTFLELGIWYYELGYTQDALIIFRLAAPNAEIACWIAAITHRPVDFAGLDATRVFPFRAETAGVLDMFAGEHWMPKYFLALIYHDRNRLADCRRLLAACGDEPGFAPFYVFRAALGDSPLGGLRADTLAESPLHDLQRAVALDPQWRYQKLLAEYYMRNSRVGDALAILGAWQVKHPDDYIMGSLYVKALLLDHQYVKADLLLSRLDILPAEGATSGHELYREAKLMQAVAAIKKGQRKKALGFIAAAEEWPAHLGVGEPYKEDQDLRLEEWLTARCRNASQPAFRPTTPLETRVYVALEPPAER